MRLKTLKIVGFKSFAYSTTIHFDGSVIAVVGPNGCGKSNIVDAFRWVMGEQSQSLRGDKMEDVLFAGTANRPPQNRAEVSLTFSGVRESLHLPFDELNITRRCTREGESEYFINGKNARLKEVHLLLSGSGVGKNALAIFEQGKLDQIIHLHPSERRKLFDEAAGIGRFLTRKKEALQKLKEVQVNCLRIEDMHGESLKKVETLKKQAALAQKNIQLQEELLLLEKSQRLIRYRDIEKKMHAIESEQVILESQLIEKEQQSKIHHSQHDNVKKVLTELQNRRQELQKNSWQLSSENKIDETKLHEGKKRKEQLERSLESAKVRIEQLQKEKIQLQLACEKAQERKESSFAKRNLLLAAFEESKKEDSFLEEQSARLLEKQKEKQKERYALLEELQASLLKRNSYSVKRENIEKELLALELAFDEEKRREKELSLMIADKTLLVKKIGGQVSVLKEKVALSRTALLEVQGKKEEQEEQLKLIEQNLQELYAKQKAWLHLEQTQEGFSEGAKLLLQESLKSDSAIYGKVQSLGEFLSPKEGSLSLLTSALGFYLDTLVVGSAQDLESVMLFARERKISHFSLFCIEHIRAVEPVKNALSHYLKPSPLGFHFLGNVRVEKSLKNVLSKLVTADGYYVDENGVIFSAKTENASSNILFRKKELKKVQEEIEILLEKKRLQKQWIEEFVERLGALKEERDGFEIALRKEEIAYLTENFDLNNKNSEVQNVKRRTAESALKMERLRIEKEERGASEKEIQEHILILEKREKALSEILAELQLSFDKKNEEKMLCRRTLLERQSAYQEAFEVEKQELSEATILAKTLHNAEENYATALIKIKNEREEKGHLEDTNRELTIAIEKRSTLLVEVKSHFDECEGQIEKEKKSCNECESHLRSIEDKIRLLKEKKHRVELSIAEIASQKRALEEEGIEEVELLNLSLDEMAKRKVAIELQLNKGGAINFASIDELEVEKGHFAHLDQQLMDLKKSQVDLEEAIQLLEKESRKAFRSNFQKIRTHFREHFALLFEGGEADLVLTSETDFFDAGVEIHAKPPGKKMQRLSLLSGGEKCLTALALLFAFFSVKPAPFCILDEVDAPLDESNIGRFTRLLQRFTKETEFIIVTHNKKTMAMADILVGVSMEEKGVSKLLSLSFEKQLVKI